MMDADTETVFCDPEVVDRVHPELYAHRTRDGRWHISVKQHSENYVKIPVEVDKHPIHHQYVIREDRISVHYFSPDLAEHDDRDVNIKVLLVNANGKKVKATLATTGEEHEPSSFLSGTANAGSPTEEDMAEEDAESTGSPLNPLDSGTISLCIVGMGPVGRRIAFRASKGKVFQRVTLIGSDNHKFATTLQAKNDSIEVVAEDVDFAKIHEAPGVRDSLRKTDVFICATDSATSHHVNLFCLESEIPCVYSSVSLDERSASVLRVRPGDGRPCYDCIREESEFAEDEDTPRRSEVYNLTATLQMRLAEFELRQADCSFQEGPFQVPFDEQEYYTWTYGAYNGFQDAWPTVPQYKAKADPEYLDIMQWCPSSHDACSTCPSCGVAPVNVLGENGLSPVGAERPLMDTATSSDDDKDDETDDVAESKPAAGDDNQLDDVEDEYRTASDHGATIQKSGSAQSSFHGRKVPAFGRWPASLALRRPTPDSPPFFIEKCELDAIERNVRQYRHVETGGDLFGSWSESGHESERHIAARARFALGPGINCARTSVSFYQDDKYLKRAGDVMVGTHQQTQIGQWHSHHGLRLYHPSHGDCQTVADTLRDWNELHKRHGLAPCTHYVMCIATLDDGIHFQLSPYVFTYGHWEPVAMRLVEVTELEPLRSMESIVTAITYKAEDEWVPFYRIEKRGLCAWLYEKTDNLSWAQQKKKNEAIRDVYQTVTKHPKVVQTSALRPKITVTNEAMYLFFWTAANNRENCFRFPSTFPLEPVSINDVTVKQLNSSLDLCRALHEFLTTKCENSYPSTAIADADPVSQKKRNQTSKHGRSKSIKSKVNAAGYQSVNPSLEDAGTPQTSSKKHNRTQYSNRSKSAKTKNGTQRVTTV